MITYQLFHLSGPVDICPFRDKDGTGYTVFSRENKAAQATVHTTGEWTGHGSVAQVTANPFYNAVAGIEAKLIVLE